METQQSPFNAKIVFNSSKYIWCFSRQHTWTAFVHCLSMSRERLLLFVVEFQFLFCIVLFSDFIEFPQVGIPIVNNLRPCGGT